MMSDLGTLLIVSGLTIKAVSNNTYQQDFTISFVVLRVDMNELTKQIF